VRAGIWDMAFAEDVMGEKDKVQARLRPLPGPRLWGPSGHVVKRPVRALPRSRLRRGAEMVTEQNQTARSLGRTT